MMIPKVQHMGSGFNIIVWGYIETYGDNGVQQVTISTSALAKHRHEFLDWDL